MRDDVEQIWNILRCSIQSIVLVSFQNEEIQKKYIE